MASGPDSTRGQSPVIGNILLVSIVVILAAVMGVAVLSFTETVDTSPPSVSIETTIDESDVTVRHSVGEVLDPTAIDIIVEGPNATIRYPLENFRGDAGETFEAGDVIQLSHGVSAGRVEVRVVHLPSDTVVAQNRRSLSEGIISLAAFNDDVPSNDYTSGQNSDRPTSTTTISDGGRTIKLTGSQWKYLAYSYDVTRETMITFEFKSTAEGDIHGIGLEDDRSGQDAGRIVRLYGTQNWGIDISEDTQEAYYEAGDGWRRYTVPLGELYDSNDKLGTADSLVFVMDCDPTNETTSGTDDERCKSQNSDGDPTANSYFRNVEIYEKE